MSLNLTPIALSANAQTTITFPGNLGTIAWIKLANASAYTLTLTNLGTGQDYLQPNEVNIWPMTGVTGVVGVLPSADLTGVTAGISSLFITIYLAGEEKPAGSYPYSLGLLTYVGNSVNTNATTPNSLMQDLLTPFVLEGLTATKDGSTANRLDVASGVAWLRQSDSSLGRQAPTATFFLTIQVNSTYYLDLNPDGTWSFTTAHSGQTNYLTIAQVATDASGNIATVTDKRTLNTQLLGAMAPDDAAVIQMQTLGLLANSLGAGIDVEIGYFSPGHALFFNLPQTGATPIGLYFHTWDGTTGQVPLSIGGPFAGAHTSISQGGGFGPIADQATAGGFGVPVIVAQAMNVAVTTTAQTIVLSFTPSATGMYRASLHYLVRNTGSNNLTARVSWTDPTLGTSFNVNFVANSNLTPLDGSHAVGGTIPLATMPISFNAKTGQTIQVYVQDPTNTPNDLVSVLIERLI